MEIIETPIFTRRIKNYFLEEEYRNLQLTLIINPEAGKIIQGTHGLRKLRWTFKLKGKRGGLRIIYM